ncbi:hypothetical protein [Micromonospora sp. PLK6-60]|uniref:hypothetical protein n=1 Tax=Micromonospora sp. PLK6-60 TaxID=2873383 RepID=UPI0027E16764|nr:hypothetical protein [Micromonospora sp. PLK6-60]
MCRSPPGCAGGPGRPGLQITSYRTKPGLSHDGGAQGGQRKGSGPGDRPRRRDQRAYDFVRMAAISRADMALAGSHAGVEIGPDGPSQMGLEDLAAVRAVHGSTVLYPSDAVSCAGLVAQLADHPGPSYL